MKKFMTDPINRARAILALTSHKRSSSKTERSLAKILSKEFRRHLVIHTSVVTFDVDIARKDGRVWIESDGEWHFRQVHKGHNFEYTKIRDCFECEEAIRRGILLIRVNNQTYTVEQQAQFVMQTIESWDGMTGQVVYLYGDVNHP